MREKISSEQIKQALENFKGKIKKLKTGTARNASLDGSICAASFGSSGLGQAQSRATYLKDKSLKKKIRQKKRQIKKQKRVTSWNCATNKQMRFLESIGVKNTKRISRIEAHNKIQEVLRVTSELNKEIQKRIDLDE